MSEEKKSDLMKLTGFYRKTSKSGNEYWTGSLSRELDLIVFDNQGKKSGKPGTENQPDLWVYVKPSYKITQQQNNNKQVEDKKTSIFVDPAFTEDDVPF